MNPIDTWHQILSKRDLQALDAWLDEEVVFHSPVVHTPQRGKAVTAMYLAGAIAVLGAPGFRYLREVRGERDAVLEFEVELDGIVVNGVDMIRWNDAGKVIDFIVMLRPLKAVNLVHQKMGAMLTSR